MRLKAGIPGGGVVAGFERDIWATVRCLRCARVFYAGVAGIVVRAMGEVIGHVCYDCLAPDAQARFLERCGGRGEEEERF